MQLTAPTKKILAFIILAFSTFLSALIFNLYFSSPVSAYTLNREISTTVEAISASEVKVTQEHKLSVDSSNYFFPASKNYVYAYIFPAFTEQIATLPDQITSLTVKNRKTSIPYEKTVSDGAIQLKIPYYENLESGSDLVVTVSYITPLYIVKEGGLIELSYPGLGANYKQKIVNSKEGYIEITTYTIRFVVPLSLGSISSIFPDGKVNMGSKGQSTLEYDAASLIGKSIRITVGNQRSISFSLVGKTHATNETSPDFVKDLLINYIEVALPTSGEGTEASGQTVYYSKIQPFPSEIRTDSDGNILAKIPVSAVEDGEIRIEGYALLKGKSFPVEIKSALISQIPSTMNTYTESEPLFWQVNSQEIQNAIGKMGGKELTIYQQTRKTLAYVSQSLSYMSNANGATLVRLGAVGALTKKIGVCMEYSDLLLTLLRAQGIPTRTVFGDGVGAHVDKTLKGIGHQWVGVWFPGSGWIPVDPTWSDQSREYIGHDYDHFVWYVASKSNNEPTGFNCLSWDSTSPCKEALQINTTSVNEIPDVTKLMTLQSLQQQISVKGDSANPIASVLQNGISALGGSAFGRVILSKTGLLVLFALLLYSLLVTVVSTFIGAVRKRKDNSSRKVP